MPGKQRRAFVLAGDHAVLRPGLEDRQHIRPHAELIGAEPFGQRRVIGGWRGGGFRDFLGAGAAAQGSQRQRGKTGPDVKTHDFLPL